MTLKQLYRLFNDHWERKYDEYKFYAGLHGVDLDNLDEGEGRSKDKPGNLDKAKKPKNQFLFRHPSEYENMSPEERQTLTDEMMSHWKSWADGESFGNRKGMSTSEYEKHVLKTKLLGGVVKRESDA